MASADQTKLNGIQEGATSNATDVALRDRATHTGTQAISTVAGLQSALDGKAATLHAHTTATTTVEGFMSSTDKIKLDGIATGATAYIHPANHPASVITQDASNRFVTDAEKTSWNAKQPAGTYATGTGTASGTNTGDQTTITGNAGSATTLSTGADRTKLDGIDAGANNYAHPTNHPASVITQDASNRFVTDAEKTSWNAKQPAGNYITVGSNASVGVTDDTTTNAARYLTMTASTSGSASSFNVSSTKLAFNPSTGDLSATNFNSTSDANKKTNVRTVENALDLVCKMRGVKFDWRDTGLAGTGVIAQEMETVLPEVVSTSAEGDKSVSYGTIIGVLIEAIKEQQAMIDQLMSK